MNEKAKESLNKAGNICLFVKENCNDEQTARYMAEAIEAINEAVKFYEAEKQEWEKESESWHGIARCFAMHDAITDERLDKFMKSNPGNVAKMHEALERCNELFRCDDDNRARLCHLARKADEATQAALAPEKGDTE